MAKIGRNELCPCGSGKKFKKCHGSLNPQQGQAPIPAMTRTPKTPPPVTADVDMLGLPGMQQHLLMRRHYKNPNDSRNAGDLGGMRGEYKVVFTLSRPGFPLLPERRYSASSNLKGDSHLAIAKPALKFLDGNEFDQIEIEGNTPDGHFVFTGYRNDKGFLGKIESETFDADNFSHGALKAHQALAPALSRISLYLDIPVHIYQMDVTELRTGNVRMSITAPFSEVPASMTPYYGPSDQLRKYASLYREALNSNSPNYQFLCLYKIIEGLRDRRQRLRTQAAVEAKARGEKPPSYPEERIPKETAEQIEWLSTIFPLPQRWDVMGLDSIFISEAVDRKISNLIDKSKELHDIRNKISHAVLDSGEPTFSIDEGLDIEEVNKWLPITKCLARYLLKEAFTDIFKNS
jgi:hypothetical protein